MTRFRKKSGQQKSFWSVPKERESIRIAVAGAGKMARSHLEVLKQLNGVQLVGISSRTKESGQKLANDFPIQNSFQKTEEMIEKSKPDAIIIAVSHSATVEATTLALKAGIPCLVEKPAGYNSDEVLSLVKLAEKHNVLNLVALNRRFTGTVLKAYHTITQFGSLRGIQLTCNEPISRIRQSGKFESWICDKWLIANTIHYIDLLRYFGGDIDAISGFGRSDFEKNGENSSVALKFKDGTLGTFTTHFQSTPGYWLRLFGDNVMIDLSPMEKGQIIIENEKPVPLELEWYDKQFKPGLCSQMVTFLNCLCEKNDDVSPGSNLPDHLKTIELIEDLIEIVNNS